MRPFFLIQLVLFLFIGLKGKTQDLQIDPNYEGPYSFDGDKIKKQIEFNLLPNKNYVFNLNHKFRLKLHGIAASLKLDLDGDSKIYFDNVATDNILITSINGGSRIEDIPGSYPKDTIYLARALHVEHFNGGSVISIKHLSFEYASLDDINGQGFLDLIVRKKLDGRLNSDECHVYLLNGCSPNVDSFYIQIASQLVHRK